jgi:hypothetical protein
LQLRKLRRHGWRALRVAAVNSRPAAQVRRDFRLALFNQPGY